MARTKHFLPSVLKSDLGDSAIREILSRENLSLTQLKRVFSYSYGRLASKKGKEIYEAQKHIVRR